MKNIGFFKKILLYLSFRRILLKNKEHLLSKYNLRIDRVSRLYTVLNIPETFFEEPYNMKTSDITKISEPYIAEFLSQVSSFLNENKLLELYKVYNIQKVDKYSYLIIIGFSLFDSDKVARNLLFKIFPILLSLSIVVLILKHFKLFPF